MKKSLSVILALILFFVSIPFSAVAYDSMSELPSSENLYIVTKECPKEYIEYASDNIMDFILSVDPEELPDSGVITVGTPFSFGNSDSDMFYFPVLCDNEIIYLLRVFTAPSGNCEGILSKTLTKELNKLSKETTQKTPLTILMEDDSIVAYVGKESTTIFEYPEGTFKNDITTDIKSVTRNLSSPESMYITVDAHRNEDILAATSMDKIMNSLQMMAQSTNSIPTNKYLGTKIIETQGNLPWCAAYSTAMIVRYVKGGGDNTKAIDVMKYFYSNPTSNNYIGEGNVIVYANSRSIYPTRVGYTLSINSLVQQIVYNKPVYLRMKNIKSTESNPYHAIVLNGYNTSKSRWRVWNPWYDEYDSFTMGGTYVPLKETPSKYTYEYRETIYDWQ